MSRPTVRGRPIYTLRIGATERALLERAAAQRQEPLSEYIRRVAVAAAISDLDGPARPRPQQ